MNISDLPPELFELVLKNMFYPHIAPINTQYTMSPIFHSFTVIELLYNNRNLLLYYFSYRYTNFKARAIYYCVKYNSFRTIKYLINNNIVPYNDMLFYSIKFNRLKILKWIYYKKKLQSLSNNDIICAIMLNKINIIKWMKSINVTFTQYHIDRAFVHNKYKIFKLLTKN